MSSTARLRAHAAVLACLAGVLSGCSSPGLGSKGDDTPMGWNERVDEPTGISFSLPVPVAGPEQTRRPGKGTPVATRSYAGRAGDLTLSVQFLSTPERPEALTREVPAHRAPFEVIDQIRGDGDYQAQVLSNDRVDEMAQPTFDAHLELSSVDEEALWWMRTRAFDDFVMVTQAVAFGGEDVNELEPQVRTAFERLNDTVEVPADLRG